MSHLRIVVEQMIREIAPSHFRQEFLDVLRGRLARLLRMRGGAPDLMWTDLAKVQVRGKARRVIFIRPVAASRIAIDRLQEIAQPLASAQFSRRPCLCQTR